MTALLRYAESLVTYALPWFAREHHHVFAIRVRAREEAAGVARAEWRRLPGIRVEGERWVADGG